jgi:mRNA-degrading endonuclease RelE of RelBE toxin-antitoxin system
MALDLDELNEDQRQMLLEYLQEEQAKNPEQFSFPKEKLEQLLMNNKIADHD